MIDVRNLHKTYNGVAAVDGPSFHVERGDAFGFIGPNGAGKNHQDANPRMLLDPSDGEAYPAS